MGRLSYSLNLYQSIGLGSYVLPWRSQALGLVIGTTLTFAMAAASHCVVERPFPAPQGSPCQLWAASRNRGSRRRVTAQPRSGRRTVHDAIVDRTVSRPATLGS
jgi:peptidoglycan/LPS O-acetylase OafA/YrhL